MKRLFSGGLLSAVLLLGGCIAVEAEDRHIHTSPTLGKELADLKSALDKGLITTEEHAMAKSRLIRGGNGD